MSASRTFAKRWLPQLRALQSFGLTAALCALLFSPLLFTTSPAAAQSAAGSGMPTGNALVISVGDLINVTVFDTPSLSFQARVDESGNVKAPILGPVSVSGLTTGQVAQLFEDRLRTGNIMLNPSVSVQDTEYATQGIVVLGEVGRPGTYTLLGPHSLYDALSAAGGTTETAGATITITHHGDGEHPEIIPVNSVNYSELQRSARVYPGDMVFVSKAAVVYLVGDFGHPGAYYMDHGKQLSVLQLLALAQGTTQNAAESRASIIRQTSDGVKTIPVNLKDIKSNKIPDVTLQSNDILVLPRSTGKVLLAEILPGATVAVISALITALIIR